MTSKNDLGLQERDQHDYDDHRRPLVRALRLGSSALLVVTIVSLMSWGGYQGLPGIWGVLIGAAIAGGFLLVTVASVLTASTTPTTTGAVVLGTWLMKVIVVLMVLVLIRDLTFYSHVAFFVTLLVALIVVLATEAYGVITSRVTYLSA